MIQRIRALIVLAVEPRRSPNMRIRARWWICVFTLLGLGLMLPTTRLLVEITWTAVNGLYLLGAVVWCCFHPRSLLGVREISLRWSVLLTILAGLILFSQLYGVLEA